MLDPDELDMAAYCGAVAESVAGRAGWSVDAVSVVLGFFSFGKFLMYRDLDAANWPEGAGLGEHPILRALLAEGFREPPADVGDDEDLDAPARPGRIAACGGRRQLAGPGHPRRRRRAGTW